MIKFLVLILVALIVFPIVIFLVKKVDLKTKLMFLVGGLVIALLGMLVQSTLSLYYALLIMVGLVFAGAILITKQIEKQNLLEEDVFHNMPQMNKETFEKPSITEPVKESIPPTPSTAPETPTIPNAQEDWLTPKKKEEL
ncbi:hypothetical protein [Paenisporosarcina indica]|uniref:hypothetical protein n=1 Tax=Paenisporosarcina indica TaxID=650093 RepID=UPI0009501315|nr:hypothetical protein [Paenisporosarcina indica]